jgi:hypothetical protein
MLSEEGVVPLLGVVSASNIFARQFEGADFGVNPVSPITKSPFWFGSGPKPRKESPWLSGLEAFERLPSD